MNNPKAPTFVGSLHEKGFRSSETQNRAVSCDPGDCPAIWAGRH
jgi:hypothetical protein